jgi:hypothetical protein
MWPSAIRFACGVAIIAAMVWGPGAYGWLTSGERLAPGLANADGPVNVMVRMSFRPQTFHRQALADYGIFGGIRGSSVVLFNVSPARLHRLDDLYWVDAIVPFKREE